ncbi:hypothetical protein [Variovorax sp. J31P207]|uniref:hypothetical protein n=1 Tax=Variovorax sp. J31P207 TaxID=3053510 RepID=UPI0025771CEC|nr:hypothetical protein [Variovorax sp. J31P207]MDM0067062.1 hypothetical protein [Variovorax sp. J31P207]
MGNVSSLGHGCGAAARSLRLIFPDEETGIAYWSTREWKKWAVHVVAGPAKKPSYKRTAYVRARTREAAIAVAKRDLYPPAPRSARFDARLAGPHELGCVPTAAYPRRDETAARSPASSSFSSGARR